MYDVLIWCMRISQTLDFLVRLPVPDFLLALSFPFSRPFNSRYLLHVIFFLAAVKVGC